MRTNLLLLAVALVATTLYVAPSFAEEAAPATKCPVTKGADGAPICDYTKKKAHHHAAGEKCDPANCPVRADGAVKCDPANCPVDKCPVPMSGETKTDGAMPCDPADCPVDKCPVPMEGKTTADPAPAHPEVPATE